ncbi:MAG: RNA polymerase sigma factor, partial [Planctomycetota bacterium]
MRDLTDAELVTRYARKGDEASFAEIARRHGPMVYGACRRLLGESGATDDAVQAVFMLLARKAGSLSRREALVGWLHGAASLVAREHLRAARRRRRAEREAAEMRAAAERGGSRDWDALRGELDAAIGKLPRHYREAVLLSCVEGRSEAEAARELGVPAGTVKSRVSRGLEKLRERLAQRGTVLGVAALAGLLAEHAAPAMPAALAAKVTGLASGGAAGAAAASVSLLMMEGALKAMLMFKIKVAAAVLGTVLLAGAAVPAARGILAGEGPTPSPAEPEPGGRKPAPAGGIAWGQAVGGLQAGLVPLGGDAGKGWGEENSPFFCPNCAGKPRDHCMDPRVAAARRVCAVCGKAKPSSAQFAEGQPMRIEVHLRNTGGEPMKAAWAQCSWQWRVVFTSKKNSS